MLKGSLDARRKDHWQQMMIVVASSAADRDNHRRDTDDGSALAGDLMVAVFKRTRWDRPDHDREDRLLGSVNSSSTCQRTCGKSR